MMAKLALVVGLLRRVRDCCMTRSSMVTLNLVKLNPMPTHQNTVIAILNQQRRYMNVQARLGRFRVT